MLHLRMVRAAETQRVEVGDRARAHGEDVAQYAADPGRRALIGFDIRRVVVAFHLEDGGELLAARAGTDVDHAGIFAGAADHPRRLGRQRLEVEARARSEEHTSELQSLMRKSYAVFCLKKKK